ncbi:hypothetical protein Hesp01_55140 [Herbidospora sp. NBRC 101105]|nr:hypothetical protein Hesp01_55140 [Herbidospora sp. NBRC 101105]
MVGRPTRRLGYCDRDASGSRNYLPRRGLIQQAGDPPRSRGVPTSLSLSELETLMYDMYPWNRPEDTDDEVAEALQTALDRRDNGGSPER